ncbi:MAG TPA: hypothetical protein VF483_06245, partial [Gemmatimonadaceae bacterium]
MTPRPSRRPLGLWLIGLAFATAMVAVVPVDYAWTVALTGVRIPGFVTLMRRTLFEGDGIGGSD